MMLSFMARYSRSLGSTGPCRVGDQLAARFPLQLADVASARQRLESEADAAREPLGRTRFATPEVVAIGEPGAGYPLSWSVQTRMDFSARPVRSRIHEASADQSTMGSACGAPK